MIRANRNAKSGIATLELVMCMPIVLVLMIGIVWLGFSVVGQAEVTVEARHKAWQKRFEKGSDALEFLSDDFVSDAATKEIQVSPLLDNVSPPESSHDVAFSTWDHNTVDMNKPPSWQLYLTAAVNAKTGGLQNAYEDARGILRQLQNMAGRLVVEEIVEAIRDALDAPLRLFESGTDNAKTENEGIAMQEKREIEGTIAAKEAELKSVKALIKDLKEKKGDAEDDKQEESLESRIKINGNKLRRLQTELKRLKSDRKVMN